MSVTIRDPSPRQLIVSAVIAIVFMALAFWYLLSANGPSPGAQDAPGIAFSVAGASQCPRPATLERPRVSPRTFLRHPAVSAYRRETSCTNPALSGVGVTASDVVTVSANDLTGHCNQKAVVSVTIAPTPALIQHIKGNPAKLSFGLAIAGSGLSRPSTTFARPYFFEPPGPAAGQLGHIEAPIQIPLPQRAGAAPTRMGDSRHSALLEGYRGPDRHLVLRAASPHHRIRTVRRRATQPHG